MSLVVRCPKEVAAIRYETGGICGLSSQLGIFFPVSKEANLERSFIHPSACARFWNVPVWCRPHVLGRLYG